MSNTHTTFTAQYYLIYFIILIGLLLPLNDDVNLHTFLFINHWSNTNLPRLLILHTTELANGTIAIGLALLALNRFPQYSKQVLSTTILLGLITHYIKEYFNSPRPPSVLAEGQFSALDSIATVSSFPSGHTATIFALLTLFWLNTQTSSLLKNSLLFVAILVGLSRISVGVHWPIDVAFGAFFGWLAAFVVCRILPVKNTINPSKKSDKFIIIFLCLLVASHALILRGEPREFANADSVYWVRDFVVIIVLIIAGWQLFGNHARAKNI